MRWPLQAALLLGMTIAVLGMAGPYVAVTFLPAWMELLMPVLLLAIPLTLQWPHRFDLASDRWTTRLFRRLILIAGAALVAAGVGWVELTAVPSYSAWADGLHRASLVQAGKTAEEIDATIAQHHQTPPTFAFETAVVTAVPGTLCALFTLGVGAIVFRRRPARP